MISRCSEPARSCCPLHHTSAPYNAIELTAAYLDLKVNAILANDRRNEASVLQRQHLAAVVHLCGTGPRNLTDRDQLRQTIYGYNHSWTYVDKVMAGIDTFDQIGVAAGGAAVPEASGRAAVIIAAARKWTGTPYAWGGGGGRPGAGGTVLGGPSRGFAQGAGTIGFDCSGLTQYAYVAAGIQLPRVSGQQALQGQRIPRSAGLEAVAPGDLIFFGTNPNAGTGIYHVAIYLGGGQMIDAPRTGTFVREEAVWMSSYAGAVHFP